MTSEEWEDLKSQVDDSFWVMRIIGQSQCITPYILSEAAYQLQVIRRYPTTTKASPAEHTSEHTPCGSMHACRTYDLSR